MILPLLAAAVIGQSPVPLAPPPSAPMLAQVQQELADARVQVQRDQIALQVLKLQRDKALDDEVQRFMDSLVPVPTKPLAPTQPKETK